MKKIANLLIVIAAILSVVWIICRVTCSLLPAGISVKGMYHFIVVTLLFAIALLLEK